MTTLSGIPIMGQLFCVQQSQPLTVLLEVKRQGGEALAELGQPIAPPRMGFAIDRELIEAKIKELEASLAQQRQALADLKRTLDEWSRPWHPPVKKPKKQSRPMENPKAERPNRESDVPRPFQTEFFTGY